MNGHKISYYGLIVAIIIPAILLVHSAASACTSALVSRSRSSSEATLLWKHRDTGALHNFIMHHPATDSSYEFIALHNAGDTLGLESWIGMNREGLSIMNTASYNLAPDTATVKDREGLIMTMALQSCRTITDFTTLLDTLPHPLGIQANFGITEASGAMAYIEANDNGYSMYFYSRDCDTIAVRTNYSHSGSGKGRLGEAREKCALHLLHGKPTVSPPTFIDTLSCSLYHAPSGTDYALTDKKIMPDDGTFIPRHISTSSIVIESIPSATGDGSRYIMWTALGYPPVARVLPVTFDSLPHEVTPDSDGVTPAEHEADALKAQILVKKNGKTIIDIDQFKKLSQQCHRH